MLPFLNNRMRATSLLIGGYALLQLSSCFTCFACVPFCAPKSVGNIHKPSVRRSCLHGPCFLPKPKTRPRAHAHPSKSRLRFRTRSWRCLPSLLTPCPLALTLPSYPPLRVLAFFGLNRERGNCTRRVRPAWRARSRLPKNLTASRCLSRTDLRWADST